MTPKLTCLRFTSMFRFFVFLLFFLIIMVLANAHTFGQPVAAQSPNGTTPGGTIPPGGTLPSPPLEDPSQGQVRVLHLAPFDTVIDNTTVDICEQNGSVIQGLQGLVYLSYRGYISLPAGVYDWKFCQPARSVALPDIAPFTLSSGGALTLILVGNDPQALSVITLIDRAGFANRIYFPLIAR